MCGCAAPPELSDRPLVADDHLRGRLRGGVAEHPAAVARRDEVRAQVAERDERRVLVLDGEEPAEAPARDVLEEHPLDRVARTELEHLVERGFDEFLRQQTEKLLGSSASSKWLGFAAMPIHVRAKPGDYAEAVLLPGDPLRAKYIAETYFDTPVQRNTERGLLGFTGTWKGKPVSVQGTGMGCPGATIVFEELIQLGCKKLIRVGTCGGLQIRPRARRPDRRAQRGSGRLDRDAPGRQRAALPDRVVVAPARGRARREAHAASSSTSARSSPATSSTTRTRASTTAGRPAACSGSRWRPPRSSPSPRSGA